MTAIIDYDAGNIKSVSCALERLGAEYILTDKPEEIIAARRVILPGVGNAAEAMRSLREKGLCDLIKGLRRPVLGICVGMQIMCISSEEDNAEGLGLFDCRVRRFEQKDDLKVPHMGWNIIRNCESKLLRDVPRDSYVYFVHSYRPDLCCDTIATCDYGGKMWSAALKYENFYGTQFHPEKSGDIGETILKNFLAL